MKKLLILSIAVFTLFSCSDNDDNLDLIIGSWTQLETEAKAEKRVEDDCYTMNTVNFNSNSTYSSTQYENDSDGNCTTDGPEQLGTWKNNNNNTYTFSFSNDENETRDNTGLVIFSNNNNTFTLGEGEEVEVYTRVN